MKLKMEKNTVWLFKSKTVPDIVIIINVKSPTWIGIIRETSVSYVE
jgi:hypothetical protein